MDEQNHLARGLALLHSGDPRFSLEHPPLINVLSALPLLTLPELRLPLDHPSWNQPEGWYAFAEQLLWVYNHDAGRMIFLARMPIVFLTIGLALTGYGFARQLWGWPAGLVAFLLLLFDPNILAHGRYTTTDLGGTLFIFLATFLLWQLWQLHSWSWPRFALAALGLGLAFGSKHSALTFVPIWATLALLPAYGQTWRWQAAGHRLLQLAAAGLLSLVILWGLYAFEWGQLTFQSDFLKSISGVPGPMPTYWAGIEQILRVSSGGRPTFLLGQFSDSGFLAYFPVAVAVKTPLANLLLLPVAATYLLLGPQTRLRAIFLLLPAALYFLISLFSALNIGYRHLLPVLPFVYVVISGLASSKWLVAGGRSEISRFTFHVLRFTPFLAVFTILLADLIIHPHYLSFFNPAAGGPQNGYNILIDSNVDWGQDLIRLRDWLAANDVQTVNLSWFGTADPAYYDITYRPLPGLPRHFNLWWELPFDPAAPEPGIYAISVSNLWELPLREKFVFAWFRQREPDVRIGYSIFIYRVP